MSSFALRLIAAVTMVLDHLGICLLARDPASPLGAGLRVVGRISFPLFVFLVVEGCSRTRSRRAYLGRLLALAVLAQLPYSLFINHFYGFAGGEEGVSLLLLPLSQWVGRGILAAICLWCWRSRFWKGWRDRTFWWLAAALAVLLCPLQLSWKGYLLCAREVNVLYLLALAVSLVSAVDQLRWGKRSVLLFLPAVAAFFFLPESYGFAGVCLAAALAAVSPAPSSRALAILLWSVCYYGSLLPQRGRGARVYVLGGAGAAGAVAR